MDIIETINGAEIQHGPLSQRIYLMRLGTGDVHRLIAQLDHLALTKGYGKIFAKIPATRWNLFASANYLKEAVVPGFFAGDTDGFFVAKYFSAKREKSQVEDKVLRFAQKMEEGSAKHSISAGNIGYTVEPCRPADAGEMAGIYRKVFQSYPFPIHDPAYLEEMMDNDVHYFGIRVKGRLVAIAAAEPVSADKNVEMTDFATVPEWRGRGGAGMLLRHMDQVMGDLGIRTAYTIARAESDGINAVFQRNGYNYAGLLKNNTHISGRIQDMTVWYKHL